MKTQMAWARAALTVAATLWPALAWAHVEEGRAEGFLAGLHHPISGLDHVLAMVSVGLWGAQLGAPAVWILPVTFPMVMAFGGMLGLLGVPLPGVEVGIALSGILLGVAVLSEWRPPLWSAAVIVGFFAVFHGHARTGSGGSGELLWCWLRCHGYPPCNRDRDWRDPPLELGPGGDAGG
jgi:urease accessory protein